MRPLLDLIDPAETGWAEVERWVSECVRPVEVLAGDRAAREETLHALQITSRSVLGAIALHCGGLLVDHGWIRMLGSGHPRIGQGLRGWNASLGGPPLDPPLEKALVVAYDVLGGIYAINGGRWSTDLGTVHYFSPDTFGWEPLDLTHSSFVQWALSDGPTRFYEPWRWRDWEVEVAAVGPDHVIAMWPPLGFEGTHGKKIALPDRARRPVPAREHWGFANRIGEQLVNVADGAVVQINLTD